MSASTSITVRVSVLALPRARRDEILGDLLESGRSGWGLAWESLRIAARYHGECYRDADDRFRIGVLFAATALLVWAIPEAASRTFGATSLFTDPVTLAILAMWRAAHLTSAVASGLLVGRSPLIAPHAGPARVHVTIALVGALFLVHPGRPALLAAAALIGAAWLGHLARRSGEDGPRTDDSRLA